MTGGGWNLAPGEADSTNALIDAFAHELAQNLRDYMGGPDSYPGEPERILRYVRGWHDAANMIDPEVAK